jgi:GAF domain-containing protein
MIYLRQLKPANVAENITRKGLLAVQREVILQYILNVLLLLYTVGFAGILLFSADVIRSGRTWIYLLLYGLVAAVTIFRGLPYFLRAGLVITALQALGGSALISYGLSGTGVTFLFASILLSLLFFNFRDGWWFILTGFVVLGGVGFALVAGRLPMPPVTVLANSASAAQWITAGLVLLFAIGITGSSLAVIVRGMDSALVQREQSSEELEKERASLEQRVEERSADLRKRVDQFEIASQIARDISGETNMEGLLVSAVNQIRDRFGYYHVSVFVNDDRSEYAVLRAATGDAGIKLLERGHRLKIGEIGLVGFAASRGEARIAMDVAGDIVHYKNPLLPDTRSEMALPLRSGERTIGALDVQSVVENAFTQDDVRILQTIADQLAAAFEKTRLMQQLQRNLEEMESSARSTTEKAWRSHLRNSRQRVAYRYADARLDTQVTPTESSLEAMTSGKSVLKYSGVNEHGQEYSVFAVPIQIRNHTLGVVDIRFSNANVSQDLIHLIEGAVSRMAVSLENARLMEEVRFRAERERLVGEITSRVRAAPDVDSVLQVAIQEIGRSLGVEEVMIQLG